jgi:hypothetical protein
VRGQEQEQWKDKKLARACIRRRVREAQAEAAGWREGGVAAGAESSERAGKGFVAWVGRKCWRVVGLWSEENSEGRSSGWVGKGLFGF